MLLPLLFRIPEIKARDVIGSIPKWKNDTVLAKWCVRLVTCP